VNWGAKEQVSYNPDCTGWKSAYSARCLISEEGFSTVAREIDRGEYDRYLEQFEISFQIDIAER